MEEFTEQDRNQAEIVKMCIVGDSGVGKSNITSRIASNNFTDAYVATIGVEFQIKLMRTKQNNIKKMQIWDTAGQERFRTISTTYLRGSSVYMIVYDITERSTFENVTTSWIPHVKNAKGENTLIMLVGTKTDLAHKRQVTTEEAEAFAEVHQFHFMEISTKDDQESVLKLFQWLVDLLEMSREDRAKMLLLETEDTTWSKQMGNLLKNPELFRNYSGLQIYEPIVKLIAPGLLNKEVIDWIVSNSDTLTPGVTRRLAEAAHFFGCEKKNATLDQLVHLYLVSHACKFDLLGQKIAVHLAAFRKDVDIEKVVKKSPKLSQNSSVVDLNAAATLLIERVHECKALLAAKMPVFENKRYSELWKDLIGQLYATRDFTGDFSVIVNGHAYKAHKPILAFAAPFFNVEHATEMRLDLEISSKTWERLLQYLYTHHYEDFEDAAECLEVLSIAHLLQLDQLGAADPQNHSKLLLHCDTVVYSSITNDRALDRLVAAINREDPVDKRITMRYWMHHYEELYNMHESKLVALPKSIMFVLMSSFLKHAAEQKYKV